jgi:hypothetical protein
MAKPITNDFIKREKYNMVPDFYKNDLTPYSQNTIKLIVLIVTKTKYRYRTQKYLIFKHDRVTAATIAIMGFEHRM